MSAIYFACQDGVTVREKAIRGSERAYASVLCNDLMTAIIGTPWGCGDSWWFNRLLPPRHQHWITHAANVNVIHERLKSFLLAPNSQLYTPAGEEQAWIVGLNTAMVLGGAALQLLIRLHAQCEVHCWLSAENRGWFADIIEQGRDTQILRLDQGWESLIEALRTWPSGPIVCSYSVIESFPFFSEELDDAEPWEISFATITKDPGLEMKPDNWANIRFGKGFSIFDLREWAIEMMNEERLPA